MLQKTPSNSTKLYSVARRCIALGLACFFLACSATRELSIEEVEGLTPEQFSGEQFSGTGASEPGAETRYLWWKDFSDERLNAVMDKALRQNLTMRQGFEQLAQAYAREQDARSSLFPQLSLALGVERRRNNVAAFSRSFTNIAEGEVPAASSVTTTSYRASVPLRWEIDLWGKLLAASQAAEFDTLATEERIQSLSVSVASQTVDTYYQVVELCSRLALLEETIEADEQFYEIIQKRYRGGVADALDVYQARQNVAVRRSERPQYQLELRKALSALSLLQGEYPQQDDICDGTSLPESFVVLPVGVPADLLQKRPDVREAFYRLDAADRRLAFAIRDRLPSLIITGSGGYEDLDFEQLFRPETLVWRLVADASMTLFDGGRKRAQVDLQDAVLAEQGAAYVESVLQAFREVEDALSGTTLIAERIELLEARVLSAQRTQRYSMEQYLQGLRNYLPVLDAQRTYYFAQRELLAARRAMISNHADLARAVGGAWEEEQLRNRFLERTQIQTEESSRENNGA